VADISGELERAYDISASLRSELDRGALITTNVISPSRVRNRGSSAGRWSTSSGG